MKDQMETKTSLQIIHPGTFDPEQHWYPKAFNATIHPMVIFFMGLSDVRIAERYCHLHPMVDRDRLLAIMRSETQYFKWSGADLINVTEADGRKQMVVIENNSCPSGHKSMPLVHDNEEAGSYKKFVEQCFLPYLAQNTKKLDGRLAVLYDKNLMEASGYAHIIADCTQEDVYLLYFPDDPNESKNYRFEKNILQLKMENGDWTNIRAAFRYVTQKPWNRIPIFTETPIVNPILACLSGGRNKMIAAKAYDIYNAELEGTGLKINIPETIWNVSKSEIPLWIKKMGGQAVIKIPYSNAGQGVFPVVNKQELEDFMAKDYEYDQFIVQSLIGNYNWSSTGAKGKYYHVGTIPNAKGQTFVTDVRMMVCSTKNGFIPLCIYARRAKEALGNKIDETVNSSDMLITNLSRKIGENQWDTDTTRLLLMDRRDFNKLGIGLDDLIEGYLQSILSTIAIDNMAKTFTNSDGGFRISLFEKMNNDPSLMKELYHNKEHYDL